MNAIGMNRGAMQEGFRPVAADGDGATGGSGLKGPPDINSG
jgi:hypothetical protein